MNYLFSKQRNEAEELKKNILDLTTENQKITENLVNYKKQLTEK